MITSSEGIKTGEFTHLLLSSMSLHIEKRNNFAFAFINF